MLHGKLHIILMMEPMVQNFLQKMLLSLKGEEPREMAFGVQTDRYAAQLLDLAEIVRGEKANDQDYDRDLKVHEILMEACGEIQAEQSPSCSSIGRKQNEGKW